MSYDSSIPVSRGLWAGLAIEARLAGYQPFAVSHQAATIEIAVTEAADKLQRAIESKMGRLKDR
jgi:hypothetical protein